MLNIKYREFVEKYQPELEKILEEHDLTYPNLSFVGYSKLIGQLTDLAFKEKYPNEDKLIK